MLRRVARVCSFVLVRTSTWWCFFANFWPVRLFLLWHHEKLEEREIVKGKDGRFGNRNIVEARWLHKSCQVPKVESMAPMMMLICLSKEHPFFFHQSLSLQSANLTNYAHNSHGVPFPKTHQWMATKMQCLMMNEESFLCVYRGCEVDALLTVQQQTRIPYSRPNTIDTVAVMVMSPVGMGVDTNLEAPAV